MMSSGEFLSIEPQELRFPLELNKQISSTMQLTNKTDNHVAFKVKTTNPKKYSVRPNTGIILPNSTCDVIVTMQAQKEAPADMQSRDKFLLQSVVTGPETTVKDVTSDLFNKESGNLVEECKLKVTYISPSQPTSPAPEGSDEGFIPHVSVSDNGSLSTLAVASKAHSEPQDDSSEASAIISRLTEERNSAIDLNGKLRQEMELLRRECTKRRGAIPFIYVIVVGLVGIILGYLFKRT